MSVIIIIMILLCLPEILSALVSVVGYIVIPGLLLWGAVYVTGIWGAIAMIYITIGLANLSEIKVK